MNDLVGVELPLKEEGDLRQVSQFNSSISIMSDAIDNYVFFWRKIEKTRHDAWSNVLHEYRKSVFTGLN